MDTPELIHRHCYENDGLLRLDIELPGGDFVFIDVTDDQVSVHHIHTLVVDEHRGNLVVLKREFPRKGK